MENRERHLLSITAVGGTDNTLHMKVGISHEDMVPNCLTKKLQRKS